MKKTAIIGGGAAGMMAAASMIEHGCGCELHLFEKNLFLGAKVIISGGGRCNVTTGIADPNVLLSKYTRGADFLRHTLELFSPQHVINWFQGHGVRLKTEPDLRVFPVSNHGRDIVGVFENLFTGKNITLHLGESVKTLNPKKAGGFQLVTNKASFEFDHVVVTTGGNAYSHTGSTGDGYAFAKSCGHTITELGPSLNSFLCAEDWVKSLSGISLPTAMLRSRDKSGKILSASGPLLFTHFGISGPVTFALSSHLAFTTITREQGHPIALIPIADRDFKVWEAVLRKSMEDHGSRQIKSILTEDLPARLAEAVLELAGIPLTKKAAEVSKAERTSLAEMLSGKLTITLQQRRPGDEFVTAGGVRLDEVDPLTMQSKVNHDLYFAGEVLDIDGLTGGFNLQSSWATGWLAGSSIAKKVRP